jgi:hypothetical protein
MRNIKHIPTLIVLACLTLPACLIAPATTAEPAIAQPPIEEPVQPEAPTPLPPTAAIPTEPPLPTNTPLPPPTPALTVIYQDDFSDPNSGWEHYREPADGILDYEDGAYRMLVQPPQNTFWVNANLMYDNVIVEVDAARREGPEENVYGLMCRLDSSYNAYMFVISSTGNYGIAIWKDHNFELLGSGVMEPSSSIKTGTESNLIRATCMGSVLSLAVNGEELIVVTDDHIPAGDIGLVAGTRGAPGADILFDNFTVYQP